MTHGSDPYGQSGQDPQQGGQPQGQPGYPPQPPPGYQQPPPGYQQQPPPGYPQPYGYQQPPAGYPPPPAQQYGNYGPPAGSGHPVQLTIQRADKQSRLLALFSIPFFLVRLIAAIPVLIVLYFVGIAMFIVAWIAQWAILFTGHYPVGMHRFVTGVMRWQVRLNAWILGATDKYPGFTTAP
jgi:Domain of unknown function (DUF4389)